MDASPPSRLSNINSARLAVQVEEEPQHPKVPAATDNRKHTRMPLLRVHSLKAFERQAKET
jgi:hypothetical protein